MRIAHLGMVNLVSEMLANGDVIEVNGEIQQNRL